MEFGGCFSEYDGITTDELIVRYQLGQVPFDPILYRMRNLIYRLASKEFVPNYSEEELQQELALYLEDAAKRYDPSRGSFSTIAYERLRTRILWLRRLENNDKRRISLYTESLDAPAETDEGEQGTKYNILPFEDQNYRIVEILSSVELDERESLIVSMVLEGHMNRDIARRLKEMGQSISPSRVGQILRSLQPKFAFLKSC